MLTDVRSKKTFFLSLFIYFERDRERASGGGAESRRERIPSRLSLVRTKPDAGLKLMNQEIMTWAEIKSQTLSQLSHPGAPRRHCFI